MCVSADVSERPSTDVTNRDDINAGETVADELYSLLDEVDSESIAEELRTGIHSKKHDFDNHLKIGILEGVHPSDSLAELAEKTATHDQLPSMAGSTFSRRTTATTARSFVSSSNCSTPHSCIISAPFNASVLTGSPALSSHSIQQISHSQDQSPLPVNPTKRRLFTKFSQPTVDSSSILPRADGEYNHPLGVAVTGGDTREPTQFEHLQSDVEVFADLYSPIRVFDRGYLDYDRFCAMTRRGEDFVTLLQSNARVDVLECVQDVDITDEAGTRSVSDQHIELAETGDQFRRIVFKDVDGEVIEYFTTLSPLEYAPVEVISIYTLRTVIEILFRELKQYMNVEQFHSHSLNGALFELF